MTTQLEQAARLALEALKYYYDLHGEESDGKAITALRAALEPPAQQEYVIDCPRCGHCCPQRVHTAWQPLTDEQIDHIYTGIRAVHHDIDCYTFARAIEAAHGIKDA